MNRLRAATCTFINSIVGSFDYERLAEQYPRLEIVSSSIRAESRDYKETTTTTTRIRKRRRRRRRRKGGKKGEEDRNGWVGDGEGTMKRLFWQDTKRHFICPVVEGQSLLLVMPSSFHRCLSQPLSTFLEQLFHLLFATDAEDRFRRFIPPFTARYLSPVGNLCDARYSFPTLFFLSSPFSFFFFFHSL